MKHRGLWKKRISLWLSAVLIAGNLSCGFSPSVYAVSIGTDELEDGYGFEDIELTPTPCPVESGEGEGTIEPDPGHGFEDIELTPTPTIVPEILEKDPLENAAVLKMNQRIDVPVRAAEKERQQDYFVFDVQAPGLISILMEEVYGLWDSKVYIDRTIKLFKDCDGELQQVSTAKRCVNQTLRLQTFLEAGRYYIETGYLNYTDVKTFPITLADDFYCEKMGHRYEPVIELTGRMDKCLICEDRIPNNRTRFSQMVLNHVEDVELNTLTEVDVSQAGKKSTLRLTVDHRTDVEISCFMREKDETVSPAIQCKVFKETDEGRFQIMSFFGIDEMRSIRLTPGTYYIRSWADPSFGGTYEVYLGQEGFCEKSQYCYVETSRKYLADTGMDRVKRKCVICRITTLNDEEHVHKYRTENIRVNTGSAWIVRNVFCNSCKGRKVIRLKSIPETAEPMEVNSQETLSCDRENWAVRSFEVRESGTYFFNGTKTEPGANCYATIYLDNGDGTLTRIIGNALPEAVNGFSFSRELEPGRYYAVIRNSIGADAYESYKSMSVRISEGEHGFCEKNGHSGPYLGVEDTDLETNRVLVRRNCSICKQDYTIWETHALGLHSAVPATGSAIGMTMVRAYYDCEDRGCEVHFSLKQSLEEVDIEAGLNSEVYINDDRYICSSLKTFSQFLRFTVEEDQVITLVDNRNIRQPARKTILYRYEDGQLQPVPKEKISPNATYQAGYQNVFKASLSAGVYYYRLLSNGFPFKAYICSEDYCSRFGHFYKFYEGGILKCAVCSTPCMDETADTEAIPEDAKEAEVNQVLSCELEGESEDAWMRFTLEEAQYVTAAASCTDLITGKLSLYVETDGKMVPVNRTYGYDYTRMAIYLNPGTYDLHLVVSRREAGEDLFKVQWGVFERNYCLTHEHLYTLEKRVSSRKEPDKEVFKCVICGDVYAQQSEHVHRWGWRTTEISLDDGRLELVSVCSGCRKEKKVWASQDLREVPATYMNLGEKTAFEIREDRFNVLCFDIEEAGTYRLAGMKEHDYLGELHILKENIEEGSYDSYGDDEYYDDEITVTMLDAGHYYLILTPRDMDGSVQSEWVIWTGESYCEKFGHYYRPGEIDRNDPIIDNNSVVWWKQRCIFCNEAIHIQDEHRYSEIPFSSVSRRSLQLRPMVSGSSIQSFHSYSREYICEECGFSQSIETNLYEAVRKDLSADTSRREPVKDGSRYMIIPFEADQGTYRIQLPDSVSYSIYVCVKKTSHEYQEILRDVRGIREIEMMRNQYLLMIDLDGVMEDSIEVGLYHTEGLHLTKQDGMLTAVYYGTEKIVSQGILVFPGRFLGELTLESKNTTRVAFTENDNGCFRLDVSDETLERFYRAYVEFEDGTILYSNLQ